MLAREYRLRKSREIARVYKQGVYGGVSGVLSVKSLANSRQHSRIVVVVSKKIDKRAVVRNRNRRRLIELLATHWATVWPGYDIVISVHADLSGVSSKELGRHLFKALHRAGVIKNQSLSGV